jgi:hypothetical protein
VPETQGVSPAHDAPVAPPLLDPPAAACPPPAPTAPEPPLLDVLPAKLPELPPTELVLPPAPGLFPLPVPEPAFNTPPVPVNALRPSAGLLHAPSANRFPKPTKPTKPTAQPEARNREATMLAVLLPDRLRVVHFLSSSLSFPVQFPGDFSRSEKFWPRWPPDELAQLQNRGPMRRRLGTFVASCQTTP